MVPCHYGERVAGRNSADISVRLLFSKVSYDLLIALRKGWGFKTQLVSYTHSQSIPTISTLPQMSLCVCVRACIVIS